jgi:plasmid stabilization system protein ParE
MAERTIIWSRRAGIRLYEILDFYADRNKSTTYSSRLYRRLFKELHLLNKHPDLGIPTDYESIRGLIVGDYILFYEITDESIIVHLIWDCRQNPNDLKIK